MIGIINYDMGNLRSIEKSINNLGFSCRIISDYNLLRKADKIILPGVGHFQKGIENLYQKKINEELNELVLVRQVPILGICLGMQLMTNFSEEGNVSGLGWIKAKTKRFVLEKLKIPHIGWNNVINRKNLSFNYNISELDEFYFVHSYYVECEERTDVLFESDYGVRFISGFQKDNIFGVQFHPEKSLSSGRKLLDNFCSL